MADRDLRVRAPGERFTLRAAALITAEDRLLLVKEEGFDSYYTVGGGVRLGESTAEAAVREAREETGCVFSVDRLLYIQERFFRFQNIDHHEVTFYYLMKGWDGPIQEGVHTDHRSETLHWLPIAELERYAVVPEFLKTALRTFPETVVHIVTRE